MKLSIKEIELLFQNDEDITAELLCKIEQDERKGVQNAIEKWKNKRAKLEQLHAQFDEMLQFEGEIRKNGYRYIAGIDEVGRGPLAGPVIASAVILPENFRLLGLTDSKKLTSKTREEFYEIIISEALCIGIGIVDAKEIDRVNIYEATKLAMLKAIKALPISPEHLLIDAMTLQTGIPQTSIIKGDSKSISIAASSVVAKVTRDRYMESLAKSYPHYGFETNMGYGTKEHLEALDKYGICEEHRKSFAPVRERYVTNTLF